MGNTLEAREVTGLNLVNVFGPGLESCCFQFLSPGVLHPRVLIQEEEGILSSGIVRLSRLLKTHPKSRILDPPNFPPFPHTLSKEQIDAHRRIQNLGAGYEVWGPSGSLLLKID